MAGFTFDPQTQLGGAAQGLTNLPVIIGLPSKMNPVPNFVIGVSTTERARTSSQLTGHPVTDGDLFLKTARNPGTYSFEFIVSEQPNVPKQTIVQLTTLVQQLGNIASALIGGGVPNLTGFSTSFTASQIIALQNMKDGAQPIFALNLYMPLSAFSIRSSYLSSSWYIETLEPVKAQAEHGFTMQIGLREMLNKTNTGLTSIITNLANQLIGPAVGSSVGSLVG